MAFDPPRSWETTAKARGMTIWFQGTVTDAGPGAGYTADLELHPKGLAWLVVPFALLAMPRQDHKHMHRIREALEPTTVPSPWRRSRLTGSAERRQSGRVGRYRLENAFRYVVARA